MHPVLFHVGSFSIYTYGVLVAFGVMLGLWYARRQAPRAGLDPDLVWNLGIYMVLTALVVAKLWLVLLYLPYYLSNPREIFSIGIVQSGGTFYGGVLGGIAMVAIYAWRKRSSVLPLLDTYATGLPLGHAIGRLGCFMAGCCYGKPTNVPWGVTFLDPVAARLVGTPVGIRLHPTELYESFAELCNFALLVVLSRRQRFKGQLAGTYLLLYGFERGVIEFFRGDPDRTMLFHNAFSIMQVVSVAFILTGSFLWWRGTHPRLPLPARVSPRHS